MRMLIDFFTRHGYMLELLCATVALCWWMERRSRFGWRCAATAVLLLLCGLTWGSIPVNLYTQMGYTLVLWLISTAAVWCCFKVTLPWAVFYATAAGTMQHIIFRGAKLLQNAVYRLTQRAAWAWDVLYLPLAVVLFVACYFVFARRLQHRSLGVLPGHAVVGLLVGFQLCTNLFANLFNTYSAGETAGIYTVYSLFDWVAALLLFALLCEILDHRDAEQDNAVLQQMMRQQRQQLELSKDTVELINIKCHDIKKQLAGLGGRVPTQELEELRHAVEIYDIQADTGNETLNVLLAERSLVCKSRDIQFDYIVDGQRLAFLKPGEVYSLFGNALDNAIEAVSELEKDRRYIGLQVREERGRLLLRIENCLDQPPQLVDGLPQTTKGDTRYHGFGVKSIRRIVEQHGGTLTLCTQNGMFRLAALLPLPDSL